MAGKAFPVIDVIDLSHVRGGFERSAAVQRAVVQAMGHRAIGAYALPGSALPGYADTERAARRKDDSVAKAALSLISRKPYRRSGSGPASCPTPAAALPPTSTLTR